MSDANYWLKLAKLDQGTLGTTLSLNTFEKKLPIAFLGILTVSTAEGQELASIGQKVQNKIANLNGLRVVTKLQKVVRADYKELKETLTDWTEKSLGLNLILTVGGTGFNPSDAVPEATKAIIEKEAPGFNLAMIASAIKRNPGTMLFRGVCGIRKGVLIMNLPDEIQACNDFLETTMPALPFALAQLRSKQSPRLQQNPVSAAFTLSTPVVPRNPFLPPQSPVTPRHGIIRHSELPPASDNHTSAPHHLTPVADHHLAPVADHHLAPVADHHLAPVADHHLAPVADHHLAPVADHHLAPVADHHLAPVADHHLAPVADHHLAPVTEQHQPPGSGGYQQPIDDSVPGPLISAGDIGLLGNLEEFQDTAQVESIRVIGSRPASIATDSGISDFDTTEFVKNTRRQRNSPYPAVSMDKAYSIVIASSVPLATTKLSFHDALDCVSAEDVTAKNPIPARATAINDGYAVSANDVPGDLEVIGDLSMGKRNVPLPYLTLGKAIRITCGSPVPPGADTVILVENTVVISESYDGNRELRIRCLERATPGENIRPSGSDIRQGETVIQSGTKLDPTTIGLLPTTDNTNVVVHRLPVVAVISVGAELVEPDCSDVPEGKIRDTNRITLLTLIRKMGLPTVDCGISRDDPNAIRKSLVNAYNQADVIITTGGCGYGDNDFVKPVLKEIGAYLQFGRMKCKPGAPTSFATLDTQRGKKLFFALPGVPTPALVAFYVLVCPCLRKLRGERFSYPTIIKVKISSNISLSAIPEYQRARIRYVDDDPVPYADVTGRQAISRLLSLAGANVLLMLPAGTENLKTYKRGELVNAMVIGSI